ncbi:MAG: hypothetical protein ABFC77_12980 [Thermoguttaceae bacterium]
MHLLWWTPLIALLVAATTVVWRRRSRHQHPNAPVAGFVQAKRRFHVQRERLEAKFLQLAALHAHPNASRWTDGSFADDVAYVRDLATGQLSALVAVTLAAEEMDRSIANLSEQGQAGTAVFRFDRDHWETDGRAILNLSPAEAVERFHKDFEMIGEELAHHVS